MAALPLIDCQKVTYHYKNIATPVLHELSFQVQEGEFVLFCGQSGSGKTSIIRLLNGLIPFYYPGDLKGEVYLRGQAIQTIPLYELASSVATVFQNPKSQFFNLDTTTELLFSLENRNTAKAEMEKRLQEVTTLFQIEHLLERNIFELSGGEKQMIAIASAYVQGAEVILFDEPTSNLDLASIEIIKTMLKKLKDQCRTIIIAEHRLSFLLELVDRVYYCENGSIKQEWSGNVFRHLTDDELKKLGLRSFQLPSWQEDNSQAESTLKIEAIQCRAASGKPVLAIKDVELPLGKVIGLVGHNGVGKSGFARILAGISKAKNANIQLNGRALSKARRLRLSYLVLQDVSYQLFTERVEDELSLGLYKGLDEIDKETVMEGLHLTPWKDDHPLSLSGGQKQRVSIAAGICSGSRFMIFDEPTSGMDRFHMEQTAQMICRLKAANKLLLVITHDLELLSLVADRILYLSSSGILDALSWDEIQNRLRVAKD